MNVNSPCHETRSATSGFAVLTKFKLALLACGLLLGLNQASAQTTNVYVDPSATWIGYMNGFTLPENGLAFEFGAVWPTADLDAGFTGAIASFSPNTSEDRDNPTNPQFWNSDGSPNIYMDANFYVENDSLAGNTVTFSGYCWTNTLVDPYDTNVTAFIKDFVSDYSSYTSITTNLTGGFFSVTLTTAPGDHIQYGFEMLGPDARITNAAANGSVIISSNPPPAGPAITSITPSPIYVNIGTTTTINVSASGSGLTYQWQKNGVTLANGPGIAGATSSSLTLTNVQGSSEAKYSVQITDSALRTASASTYLVVFDPSNLSFDPNALFNGYINASANNGGTVGSPDSSFSYPVPRLRAGVTNGTAYMQPNIDLYNATDPFWANQADGSPGQWVEEDFFIANDALAGQTLTFSGFCPSNSLPAPYVATAWIEDFASDYSSLNSITTNLVAGQAFSITLATGTDPGRHIQYGLRVFGLDNPPSDPDTATAVLVTPLPPSLSAGLSNNTVNLSFAPTTPGHNYIIQYTTNLTGAAWQTLTTVPGIEAPQTVSDPVGPGARFYRVYVQ
jgi:hypothetical protein